MVGAAPQRIRRYVTIISPKQEGGGSKGCGSGQGGKRGGSLQCQCPSAPTHRYERLEEQLNDLTELHQNEMTNLKQELASMEEKVAYQSYERARDIQVGEHQGSASHCTLHQGGPERDPGGNGGRDKGSPFSSC